MALLMPLVLWAQTDKLEVTVTSSEIGYNGSDTKNAVNISVTLNGDALELGTNYSLRYLYEGNLSELTLDDVRNVGTYEVVVHGMGDNAAAIDAAYNATYSAAKPSFTVTQKAVTSGQINVDLSKLQLVYGYTAEDIQKGLESVVSVNEGVLAKGDQLTEFIKCLTLNVVHGDLEVGKSNEVSVVSKEDANTNYKFVSSGNTSGFINISPATLNISLKSRAYTGTTITASTWGTMAKSSVIIDGYKGSESAVADQSEILGLTLSAVEGNDYINVGDYKVNVAITNKNYQLASSQVDLNITPATITIAQGVDVLDNKFVKTYDAAEVFDLTDLFKISGMKSYDSDKVGYVDNETKGYKKISMKLEQKTADAGVYNIVPYVNDEPVSEEEYATIIPNYIISYKNKKTYTINTYALSGARIRVYVDESKTAYQGKDFELEKGTFIVVDYLNSASSKRIDEYAMFLAAIETKDADGKVKEPTLVEGKDFVYLTVGEDGDYTVARSTSIANVEIKNINDGTLSYRLKAVDGGNYSNYKDATFSMTRASLVISPKNGEDAPTMVYGTEAPAIRTGSTTLYDVTEHYYIPLVGEDKLGEDGIDLGIVFQYKDDTAPINAGKYDVFPSISTNKIPSVDEYATLLDNYTISFDPDSENKFVVTPKNLADEDIVITTDDPLYKGTPFTTFAVSAKYVIGIDDAGKEIVLTPAPKNNTDFTTTINTKEAIKAGEEFVATITGKGLEEYDDEKGGFGGNYYGVKTRNFEIQKATLVLTATDISFDFSPTIDASTRLTDYIYKYNSENEAQPGEIIINELASNKLKTDNLENLEISLILNGKAASGKVGTYGVLSGSKYSDTISDDEYAYAVVSNNAELNNYNVKVQGKVTINAADEIVIGRKQTTTEALLKGYSGYKAEDGTTFKVKVRTNATSHIIEANHWTAMVLPFDIKVRDFSKAIDYAIVDLPNLENTAEDAISFNLFTGTIPANTLFLFKTDENRDLANNPLEFNLTDLNVAIDFEHNYDEDESAHYAADKAGNKYYGLYKEGRTIQYANQYFVAKNTNGVDAFFPATVYSSPVAVNVLSGYIETKTANMVRIFVEDIDGTVTEISAVTGEEVRDAEGWYTINGVKLNAEPTEKGIYINNGKKVVIK